MNSTRTLLICVDCISDSLRAKITDTIVGYGNRIQYSVYTVVGTKVMFAELHRDLEELTKNGGAHVIVFDLGVCAAAENNTVEYGYPLGNSVPVLDSLSVPDVWLL